MRVLAMRVMMTGSSDGKITRAVLQHQIEDGSVSDGTYRCVWEDVRELPVSPDGRVTLSTQQTTEIENTWHICPRCRYPIPSENAHTQADCDELRRGKIPEPEPVDVPQAFYEAFRDEDLRL